VVVEEVVVEPEAGAAAVAGLEGVLPTAPWLVADGAGLVVAGALEAAGGAAEAPPDGVNVPVRCQKAENPLNGPPTTWLDHCSV
jgi:hypothetical protein